MMAVFVGLGVAILVLYFIHKLIGHPDITNADKFFLWAEAAVFVLLCTAYVLGEAQKISRGEELGLHISDALLLFAVLIVSGLIYKAFTWER